MYHLEAGVMAKDNLKPELKKYSYDALMTDAIKQSQDNLIAFGRRKAWDEVIDFVKTEIAPQLAWECQDTLIAKLEQKRAEIEPQK